jgi:hypothetical protein
VKVEILTFEGCPNAESARMLVERVATESHVDVEITHVNVPGPEAAERLRFLGSPTIRVHGQDIEPGVDQRTEYVLACRIYRTEERIASVPDDRWLRDALKASQR